MTNLGVAITTHNRRDIFQDALRNWQKHLPAGAHLVVVDDGSDIPVPDIPGATVIRHEYPQGIAVVKNAGIAALMQLGADHLFLSDDDIWPTTDNWWQPYIDSPEPHLSFQWPGPGRHQITHQDDQHIAIGFPRGCLLYAERRVINTIGGMNTAFGVHGGEHVDWQQRAHDAGLTTWPYADINGSHKLFYCRDKERGNTRGSSRFNVNERRRLCQANGTRWGHKWDGWPHFPYKAGEGTQDYSLGPYFEPTHHYALLAHVVGLHPTGVALEFGVGSGQSTRAIAYHMPVIGYDSFAGLPEDWRPEFPKGSFANKPPKIPNAHLVVGLYRDTLPGSELPDHVGLVHIDCDLLSSTRTVLEHIEPALKPGTYVVFDEWHGYETCEEHEQQAWREFADRTGIKWTVVGHSHEAWAIRIT